MRHVHRHRNSSAPPTRCNSHPKQQARPPQQKHLCSRNSRPLTTGGGGVLARSHGLVFSSAAGGAHWQIAIRCPSLPFPSVKVHQAAVLVRRFCFSMVAGCVDQNSKDPYGNTLHLHEVTFMLMAECLPPPPGGGGEATPWVGAPSSPPNSLSAGGPLRTGPFTRCLHPRIQRLWLHFALRFCNRCASWVGGVRGGHKGKAHMYSRRKANVCLYTKYTRLTDVQSLWTAPSRRLNPV